MARFNIVAAAFVALLSVLMLAANARYVDRYQELRTLQDVNNGEEETGELGHEQTVITAEAKDSTTAKATSSVHVPHADTLTADHQVVKIEEEWND